VCAPERSQSLIPQGRSDSASSGNKSAGGWCTIGRVRFPMSSSFGTRVAPFPILLGKGISAEQQAKRINSDEDAMNRLQSRDHDALQLLFDRYSKLVFRVAVRVLHDRGEAEDLVQEVFTHLFQKASLFDPQKGCAKSWILRAAFRRALDRQSYLSTRRFFSGAEPISLGDMLYGNTDWECQVVAKVSLGQLQRMFDSLSEEQRQTLQLFFFEGMTFHEIAEKFDVPLGNIRHYYYRGLEKLRENVFAKQYEHESGGVLLQL